MPDRFSGIGRKIAPWRFIVFAIVTTAAAAALYGPLGWQKSAMLGFDIGAALFLLLCAPLFTHEVERMRRAAKHNDANRALLLVITAIVSFVVLAAIADMLSQQTAPKPLEVALIVGTLVLSWLFTTLIYALHYAHLYYTASPEGGDSGGLDFPGTKEPDYWDFSYFSSCVGMTFQTSDVNVTSRRLRRIGMFHCMAAFVFNIGVIAFAINVLSGS